MFFAAFWGIGIFILFVFIKANARTKKLSKYAPSGTMPGESFEAMSYLLSALKYNPDLLNTFMMKWISNKNVEMETIARKIGRLEINEQRIKLNAAPKTYEGDVERMFFELIVKAFEQSQQDTLSVGDFQRYVSASREKTEIINHHKKISMNYCYQRGWVHDPNARRGNEKVLTAEGQKLYNEILGFGSFLYNRSFLEQKDEEYLPLLNNFLIFAELLGITSKFQKGFSRSDPWYEEIPGFRYTRSHFYYTPSSSSSSSGSGSSSGGGGGSSSGGGGGTR